jgi:hypothetical protein
MINIRGFSEDDLATFIEHLDNEVLMQRALARVKQIRAAQAVQAVGGQRAKRGKFGFVQTAPLANIDPSYYFARLHEEREANAHRRKTQENVWDDPEFLDFELRQNPALRPIVDTTGRPVFFGNSETGSCVGTAAKTSAGKPDVVVSVSQADFNKARATARASSLSVAG